MIKGQEKAQIQHDCLYLERGALELGTVEKRETSRGTLIAGPAMRDALTVLDRVASSTCTVLITGESGTGKELAVAALHDASPRANEPLIAVNCGAIPENLVESEFFGHARGAFTGASANRLGLVAAADGGTLLLDEVGELPLSVQVKLLRLLQSKEYSPVGDTRTVRSNVRIVAATHRDLASEVRKGRFREDLFYRLNVIHVELPPLRRRSEDIEPLARHFLEACARRVGRPDVIGFRDEALARIVSSDWPGNIRALENAIERGVLLARGPLIDVVVPQRLLAPSLAPAPAMRMTTSIVPAHIPSHRPVATSTSAVSKVAPRAISIPPQPPVPVEDLARGSGVDLRAMVEAYETEIVRKVLESCGWNRSEAARRLNIQRTTLIEMIKRKRLQPVPRVA